MTALKSTNISNILMLNLAVLLISTSGALGRYITLDPIITIFYRCVLAAVIFYAYCKWQGISLKITSKKDVLKMISGGFLMGAHWVTYFYSLKYSSELRLSIITALMISEPPIIVFAEGISSRKIAPSAIP